MSKRKLTPKQRVLVKWPKAYAWDYSRIGWCVFCAPGAMFIDSLGEGLTEKDAWADAARRLKEVK